jgi:hypothetical protein
VRFKENCGPPADAKMSSRFFVRKMPRSKVDVSFSRIQCRSRDSSRRIAKKEQRAKGQWAKGEELRAKSEAHRLAGLRFALCPLPSALCSLPFAPCPLLLALCPLHFAFVRLRLDQLIF